jgi:hypothetical protein
MEQRNKTRHYSHTEKIRTLRLLEKNDFNYLRTEKQSGITRKTIKQWEEQYGTEVFLKGSPTETALQEVDAEMKRNDVNILRKIYNLRVLILHRMMQLIPHETKIDPLISSLRCVSEELETLTGLEDKRSNHDLLNYINVMQDKIKLQKAQEQSKKDN